MAESGRDRLAAAIELAAQDGIRDVSLRQIAAELGTSHRMLIYHFGSEDGLLAAIPPPSNSSSVTRSLSCPTIRR